MSTDHRWSKFWWQDWQSERTLQMCSLAARGLWMEILCIAYDGTPRGYVNLNGKTVTAKHLAALVRSSEKEVTKLLLELEEAEVFSKTVDGTIFSRRMVRDEAKSEEGRANAGKRWPASEKPTKPTSPPNGSPNREAIRGASLTPNARSRMQSTEAEADPEGGRVKNSHSREGEAGKAGADPAAIAASLGRSLRHIAPMQGVKPPRSVAEQLAELNGNVVVPIGRAPPQEPVRTPEEQLAILRGEMQA